MLNRACYQGRLTADLELKHTSSDIAVCSFSIAVDRGYVKTGEQRKADFIDCVAWRQTSEFICKYFAKGAMVILEGHTQTRTYTDNAGNNRKVSELVVEAVNFCESKKRSDGGAQAAQGSEDFVEITDDGDLPF